MTATDPATGVVRTANASGLGAVERELAELHKAMLRAGDSARALRLSVVTLVIACTDDAEAERAADVVSAIAAEHPARALLVTARREAPDGIEAELRLQCSLAGGPDNQICAEIVRLRVGGDSALHLASVVAPLLLPDVPVHIWVAGAPPLDQALAADTLALVERVILDSDAFTDTTPVLRAVAAAAREHEPRSPIVDIAWLRMEPWRDLVARAFDTTSRRPLLAGVDSVSIEASGDASARLAAGWLTSRLGLDPACVGIEVAGGEPRGLRAIHITSSWPSEATVDVRLGGDGLQTQVVIDGETVAARAVPLDPPSLAELIGAALQEGGEDPVYAQALQAAAGIEG